MNKQKVLFLCTGNSARSQMAEALLRHKAGDIFTVYSAGTTPENVDSRALTALNKQGINCQNLTAKGIEVYAGDVFDYVITLCNKAGDECRSYPGAKKQLAWDFPDPKSRQGNDPFFATLNELDNRISMFLLVESKKLITPPPADLNVINFYKSLTDDIRLKTLMLTHYHGELCVCELMQALDEQSQPKVSRNLSVLKKNNIISARKSGQWVFYRINPELPLWAKGVLAQTTENNIALITEELARLKVMQNRPAKNSVCK
ncbi:metalloregulator ArsR/SmtB family transcription factor [Pseudoalteromonas sp. MMG010]|uniref:metalloregulator ArsR/SmtB family transcription factor n=1 Tax=Pseudoalteromonas sp. MMG010 TaxID=2822685 RepID=UPI001B3A1365|nr:metalloregulator ArsR/SmtB family transcription factor [Pseudoalteromonas sp. MMG010]MBQ4832044.1 metalloregulator ArsR/SmtB family transcription factor [Pseudoalteromonas sp. MMG010]